ncbi:hypothetical protein [Bradyrhizobium sp. RDT46]|uniref:hypothetical protein n=1 Tax=Bradyrhizobium sp. RDT46 TaxID=3341829 RepID=UPI0035C6E14A
MVPASRPRRRLLDETLLDQFARRTLQLAAAQRVQAIGRHAEQPGVIADAEVLLVALLEQPAEAAQDLRAAALLAPIAVAGEQAPEAQHAQRQLGRHDRGCTTAGGRGDLGGDRGDGTCHRGGEVGLDRQRHDAAGALER